MQVVDKSPDEGGVGIHVAELIHALRHGGHDVIELRIGPSGTSTQPAREDLPVTYGRLAGLRRRAAVSEILELTRPHIVHLQGCFTTLSSTLVEHIRRRVPTIGTLHDIRPFCPLMTRRLTRDGGPCGRRCGAGCITSGCACPRDTIDTLKMTRRWLADRRSRAAWASLDSVVVPSGYMRDLALMHGFAASHLRVIPHGTAAALYPPTGTDVLRPPTILYVGSLVEYKGVDLLVQALLRLADRPWQAVLAGDGPMRGLLETALARSGLGTRVRLLGHVADRNALSELFAQASLLVLPSIIPESFALVGIEALAAGTPVVSFGLGGQREWLRDEENGLIARDRDVSDLAAQIARLLDNPGLARRLGQAGQALVRERFLARQQLDALLSVYWEVLETRGATSSNPARPMSSTS